MDNYMEKIINIRIEKRIYSIRISGKKGQETRNENG